jgi:hypothetical protein
MHPVSRGENRVQGVDKGTAEEFFSRLQTNANVLHEASVEFVGEGDDVSAVACALGSDGATLESVVWERLNIAPRSPQRQFFQAVATVASSVDGLTGLDADQVATAVAFIGAVRTRMTQAFDEGLAAEVDARWGSLDHLAEVAMPTGRDMEDMRVRRLEGLTAAEFVTARRRSSGQTMLEAQARRVRGSIPEAIQAAYESDFLALEAYLVESALAVGDTSLFTVVTRWALATYSVSELRGLPSDFTDAVNAIRAALADGLGEADGARMRDALIAL